MQVICVLIRNQEVVFDFVEECFRYGAKLAWNQEAVFLEFPHAKSIYSLEKLFNSLEELGVHFDVQIRIASAEDAPTALCYAHFGVMPKGQLPIEGLRYFYSPLMVPEEVSNLIRALKATGHRTLQDIAALLPSMVRTQFGDKAWEAVRRCRERNGRGWPGFPFLENFHEQERQEMLFPVVEAAS